MKKSFLALALILSGTTALACAGGNELSLTVDGNDAATINKTNYTVTTDIGVRLAYASVCGEAEIPMDLRNTVNNFYEFVKPGKDTCLTFINVSQTKMAKFVISYRELTSVKRSRGCGGKVEAVIKN